MTITEWKWQTTASAGVGREIKEWKCEITASTAAESETSEWNGMSPDVAGGNWQLLGEADDELRWILIASTLLKVESASAVVKIENNWWNWVRRSGSGNKEWHRSGK